MLTPSDEQTRASIVSALAQKNAQYYFNAQMKAWVPPGYTHKIRKRISELIARRGKSFVRGLINSSRFRSEILEATHDLIGE